MSEKHSCRDSCGGESQTDSEKNGYQVSPTTVTGPEAVANAKRDLPDLVIMDITLKGDMNGIETAEHIRS